MHIIFLVPFPDKEPLPTAEAGLFPEKVGGEHVYKTAQITTVAKRELLEMRLNTMGVGVDVQDKIVQELGGVYTSIKKFKEQKS